MKIDIFYLHQIGFKSSETNGSLVYDLNGYKLKPELGSWLVIGEHNGNDLTGLEVIDTVKELEKHYLESTGKHLNQL